MRRIALFVLLLATSVAHAGLVSRPTKTCGQTSYVAEVAATCTTIKASELDADFDEIITGGVNNIETANINVAGLGSAAIANDAIVTAKILDGAVTSAKIADGTIVNADVNASAAIVGTKLAVNATTNNVSQGSVGGNLNLVTASGETDFMVFGSITTRGGYVQMTGDAGGRVECDTGGVFTITYRVYRGATLIHTVVSTPCLVFVNSTVPLPAPPQFTDISGTVGTFVYKITVEVSSASATAAFKTDATNPGVYTLRELT